jgi:hypothetical protein
LLATCLLCGVGAARSADNDQIAWPRMSDCFHQADKRWRPINRNIVVPTLLAPAGPPKLGPIPTTPAWPFNQPALMRTALESD